MTPRCPPRSCIPPFCYIYGMARCGQHREPSIIPGLVTPPLQWSSSFPLSSAIVFKCLPCLQTCPNYLSILCLMTYMIDSGVNVSSLILILCRLSALVTSLIAHRQRISKTSRYYVSCERSIHVTEPYIAIGNVSANCSLVS